MLRKILGLIVIGLVLASCGGTPEGDIEDPTLAVTSPTNNATVTAATLTVTGTASDNTAVTKLSYTLNGGAAVDVTSRLSGGNFSFDVPLGSAGDKTIKVTASDAEGNSTDVTRAVTYTPPTSGEGLTGNWKMTRTNDDPANIPAVLTMSLEITDSEGTLSGNAYLFSEEDSFGRGSLFGTIEGTNAATGYTLRIVYALPNEGFLELTGAGGSLSGEAVDANDVPGTFTLEELTE